MSIWKKTKIPIQYQKMFNSYDLSNSLLFVVSQLLSDPLSVGEKSLQATVQ